MKMKKEVSIAMEEYLECIYRLEEKYGTAKTSDIVKSLGLSAGTITNTLKRLKRRGLIMHRPYEGVKLTDKGRRIALEVIRRHRLSERLLSDVLNQEWDKVHETACMLEHSINEEVARLLEKILKEPRTCPHGNPIPAENGMIIEEKSTPLTSIMSGKQCRIVKVVEESSDFLRYLKKIGLMPGTTIEVVEIEPYDGSIIVKLGSRNHVLSRSIASLIQVAQE